MSTPTPPPALAPQRLIAGRYRLRRVIGTGSMGVVWLGYDEVLHRPVAVKEVQLPDGMPVQEANDARERTLREARAIAALTHPNVVAVHDVAKQGIEPFVVMELLSGRSLAQLISRRGPLNGEQTAVIADAVAAGLDAAHRRGITHRDVKPGNVMVGADGQVKLTDFGIARNVSEVTMTSSGLILGTPAYIAPEVASGEPVSPAADLWSLGATLFAAVEGRPPYDRGDPLDTINEVVHGDIPTTRPDAPLSDVIAALLRRAPDERIGLVEVRRRIRALLPEPGGTVFPADESEPDAGPADDKPTAAIGSGRRAPVEVSTATPRRLAADPGPLPFGAPPFGVRPVGAAPLAPAPGPLPFTAPPAAPSRRGAVAVVGLSVLAIVLFAASAGGGFVATRSVAGQGIMPPVTVPARVPQQAPPVRQYDPFTAQAGVPGTGRGNFTIQVPSGWVQFVERHAKQDNLPSSTAVHWVRQDGTDDIGVERFAGFFDNYSIDDYVKARASTTPGTRLPQPPGTTTEPAAGADTVPDDVYRTEDTNRTLYTTYQRQGADLWVLTLTVPTDQEGSATAAIFDRVKSNFAVSP